MSESKKPKITESPKEKVPKVVRPSKIFTEYYSSIILILITILVSSGFLVIKPKIDEYKALRANSDSLRQSIQNEGEYLAGLSRSVAAAEALDDTVLKQVDSALPREFSIPQTLVLINRAAKESSIKIASVVFSPETAKTDMKDKNSQVKSMQMTLNVTADNYQSLKQFLNSLEVSLRLIDIQMLTVANFTDGKANFSLQMRTYYFPGKE